MPKTPPDDANGYYHVVIPLDALEGDSDEIAVDIQPVTEARANELIRLFDHIGRNQSCPCGSGVKFTRCCLRRAN
jgi:uncharacterized protein YecA (UPF0149 family)